MDRDPSPKRERGRSVESDNGRGRSVERFERERV
jgi:hypothetical protein